MDLEKRMKRISNELSSCLCCGSKTELKMSSGKGGIVFGVLCSECPFELLVPEKHCKDIETMQYLYECCRKQITSLDGNTDEQEEQEKKKYVEPSFETLSEEKDKLAQAIESYSSVKFYRSELFESPDQSQYRVDFYFSCGDEDEFRDLLTRLHGDYDFDDGDRGAFYNNLIYGWKLHESYMNNGEMAWKLCCKYTDRDSMLTQLVDCRQHLEYESYGIIRGVPVPENHLDEEIRSLSGTLNRHPNILVIGQHIRPLPFSIYFVTNHSPTLSKLVKLLQPEDDEELSEYNTYFYNFRTNWKLGRTIYKNMDYCWQLSNISTDSDYLLRMVQDLRNKLKNWDF